MAEMYEVKVTIGDAVVEVKGAKEGVVAIVEALSSLLAGSQTPVQAHRVKVPEDAVRVPSRHVDARSFFQEKSPSTQVEAVSVAAYYLAELSPQEKRSSSITTALAQEVFRQAKYPLPKRLDQVLVNAHRAGYLDRVGSGEYSLSPVGWNLVEHSLGA